MEKEGIENVVAISDAKKIQCKICGGTPKLDIRKRTGQHNDNMVYCTKCGRNDGTPYVYARDAWARWKIINEPEKLPEPTEFDKIMKEIMEDANANAMNTDRDYCPQVAALVRMLVNKGVLGKETF